MSTAPADVTTAPPTGVGPWVRRLAWANLVAQIGIIVTGGAVRLTGSGLGCSTWPQCEPGEFTPQFHEETPAHAFIEFGNRTLTGVLGVIALALAVVVWRERGLPGWYRRLSVVPLVGVIVQALIGGITVWMHLHPAVVGVHMLVSLALVAASTILISRRPGAAPRVALDVAAGRLVDALCAVAVVLMVLGIVTTGAGPHSGDDVLAARYALDPVLAAKVHAGAVWLFCALLLATLWVLRRSRRVGPDALRPWWVLLGATLLQGAIGYVQYFTGLPEVLVGIHLLGTGILAASLAWARAGVVPPRLLRASEQSKNLPPA